MPRKTIAGLEHSLRDAVEAGDAARRYGNRAVGALALVTVLWGAATWTCAYHWMQWKARAGELEQLAVALSNRELVEFLSLGTCEERKEDRAR